MGVAGCRELAPSLGPGPHPPPPPPPPRANQPCPCAPQFLSLVVALVLRLCIYPRTRYFENLEEEGVQPASASKQQVQMQKLQSSVSGRQEGGAGTAPSLGGAASTYSSSRLSKSTTQKMAAK